jgi:hypothetical protein
MNTSRLRIATVAQPLLAIAAIFFHPGCTLSVGPGNGGTGSNTNRNEGSPGDDQLRVKFRNLLSNVDVDTQFFATNQVLADPANDLFVPANLIQVGIGAAGTGILLADTDDQIDVPCTDHLTIGTEGGAFRNPDTGAILGNGDQRVLQVGLIFDCGDTITFTYSSQDGQYTVDIL